MSTSVVIAHGNAPFEDIARFLEESQEDFRILRTLPSARGALDVARRTCPDLLLLGMATPFTDTFDILREAKDGLFSKVVVICARCDAGWAVEALDAGATAYLFADTDKADVVRILRLISAPTELPRLSDRTGRPRRSRTGARTLSFGGRRAARSGPFPIAIRTRAVPESEEPEGERTRDS